MPRALYAEMLPSVGLDAAEKNKKSKKKLAKRTVRNDGGMHISAGSAAGRRW